jgi:hypothetical protein
MRTFFLSAVLLCAGAAQAAVTHVPIASAVTLQPGQATTVTIDAAEPTEIGWRTVQAAPCTSNCVQATDVTGGVHYTVATPMGASMKYTPAAGRITIEYKNVSNAAVTIDIFRVRRTCEAEACRFLDPNEKGRWLVFKVDQFTSITTSADGSYSVISGVAMSGRPFTVKAVWWTDDKQALAVNCSPSVSRYLNAHTPKEQYRPYVISGQVVGDPSSLVLRAIDTCAPKADKFGVPEQNVFK